MIFFEMEAEFRRAGSELADRFLSRFSSMICSPLSSPQARLIRDSTSKRSSTRKRIFQRLIVPEYVYIYIYLVSRSILCSSSTMKYVLSRIERANVSVEEREEGSPSPLRSQILSTRDKIANTKFHNRKLDRERKKREKICSSSETCFSWSIVITVPCPVSRL